MFVLYVTKCRSGILMIDSKLREWPLYFSLMKSQYHTNESN